jgi:hypothetical protein
MILCSLEICAAFKRQWYSCTFILGYHQPAKEAERKCPTSHNAALCLLYANPVLKAPTTCLVLVLL